MRSNMIVDHGDYTNVMKSQDSPSPARGVLKVGGGVSTRRDMVDGW